MAKYLTKPPRPVLNRRNTLAKKLIFDMPLFERGGLVARDISGYQRTADLVSSPSWVVGLMGRALRFNGTSSAVRTQAKPISTVVDNFTMESWFLATSLPAGEVIPMSHGADNAGISLSIEASTFKVLMNGVVRTSTGVGASTNTLYHGVIRRLAGNTTMFINGQDIGPNMSNTPGAATDSLTLGAQLLNSTTYQRWFTGDVYSGRFWERALSNSEIQQLYRNPWALYKLDKTRLARAVLVIATAITKASTYRVKVTPAALTKALKYTVKKTPTALSKSIKYTIKISPTALSKGLVYRIKSTQTTTKTLAYATKIIGATTKSLKYTVKLPIASLTKSLQYTVIDLSNKFMAFFD